VRPEECRACRCMFSSGDKMKVQMLAMLAGYERDMISARVTSAQAVMKSHIEKKGYHETKEGERLTKLGSKDWEAVQAKGYEKVSANAMAHAMRIYPVIERCRQLGITSMRGIAAELTDRKIETPSRQAKIDKRKPVFGQMGSENGPKWHPQQVKAIIDRIENQK
jgi:DNA invertase Pin-like site-specific DNA recombinase